MLTFPTESVLNSLIVVLVRLIRPTAEPKDWRYALALSKTCNHLAQIRRHDLKTKNVLLYEGTVINEYRVFKECAAFLMTSDYKKLTNRVTTVPPLDNHDRISEDYPFYGDIATEFQQNNYMTIICNAIDIAVSASLIRSGTSSYGEPETMENGEYFQADRFDMAKKEITMIGCKINLPSDAGFNSSDKVKVIINIFNGSIFFWRNTDITINTVLVNLLFVDIKGNEIDTFPQLIDIHLNTSEQLSSLYQNLTAGLPVGHAKFNDTNVPVFRIDLRQTSHIRISFHNVSQPIKIVIQHGKRPLISDFEQSTVVDDNFTEFNIQGADYDDWLYIAVAPLMVIPHVDAKSAKVMQYNEYSNIESNTFDVSVLTQQCIRLRDNKWQQSDCTFVPDTTVTLVHCRCYTTANVAGSSISSNLEERYLVVLSFSLEYSPNYIPLILTISVIFLYCVVIIFAVFRRNTEQQIYYLGDNLPTHNYAYLTMVKTNGKLSSGTTANIVIKLHGMKSQSPAHVLNYPDPDKNLLQCGSEDYFVLTSRQYLGELNHIELWTDCLYIRPTWRCDYLKICDLQNKKWYTFNVNNIFSPLKKFKHYVSISPEEVHEKARKKLSFKRIAMLFTLRYGAEHTWNVFSKKDDRSFSFIERLSVLLTFIISTYAVTMLMCIFPNFTPTDGIHDGKIMAYLELVKYAFLTSCVTFPINTLLVFMFRNLTRKRGLRFFHNKKPFSEKIKYINWALLCVLISTSTVYVLFMSTGISLVSSYAWLIITTASLLINIIILENFYLGALDIVNIVLQSKTVYNYKEMIKESQHQKEYLSKILASRYTLRPYLTHLYKPMDAVRYKRKTAELITRLKISKTFQEFIAFIIYILLLYFLIDVMYNSHIIILNDHVKRMMEGKVGGLQFKEIYSHQHIIDYLNGTIAPTVHATNWYGGYKVNDPALILDFQTKYLGIVRIRQKRVSATTCPASMLCAELFQITKCIPPFSLLNEDTRSFEDRPSLWTYKKSSESGRTKYYGEFGIYYGGGYISHLGRTLENAYYNIMELLEELWIDEHTSLIFIEFWSYNANVNLFTLVTVVVEISSTGGIVKSYDIYTTPLVFVDIHSELWTISLFFFYSLMIFYQLGNMIAKIIMEGVIFWQTCGNYIDIILMIANLAVIYLYVQRQIIVEDILNELSQKKNNQFTLYFPAEQVTDAVKLVVATLMCIAIMRTWRFLRFGSSFKVFERTFRTQCNALFSAFLYTLVIYVLYTIIAYISFGPFIYTFKNAVISFQSVLFLAMHQLKHYQHEEMINVCPIASILFYTTYRLLLLLVTYIYTAIIMLYYEDSKEYVANQPKEFSILTYFIEEFKYLVEYIKRKRKYLKGGKEPISELPNKCEFNFNDNPNVTKRYDDEGQASGVLWRPLNMFQFMSVTLLAYVYNESYRKEKDIVTDLDYELMRSIVWNSQHRNQGVQSIYYQMLINKTRSHYMSKEDLNDMVTIVSHLFEPEPEAKPKAKEKSAGPVPDTVSLKKLADIVFLLEVADRVIGNINIKII